MRGSWHADVSTRFQRDATGARLKSLSCLLKDSCAALQVYHGCDIIPPLGAACELPRAGRRLGLEPAPMERLVAAVRLGASLKKLRSIQAAVSAASTLLASNVAVLSCVGSRRLPSNQTFAESSCAAGCLCHAVQSVARLHKASGGSCGTLRRARLRR